MNALRRTMTGLLPLVFLASALPTVASDPTRDTIQEDPDNLSVNPVTYQQETGEFQIVFPGGCGKLVTRSNEPDLFGGQQWNDIVQVTYVFCDRYQENGEGCSVHAVFNLQDEDGGMAKPEQVIQLVEGTLKEYGVQVVSQKAIKKDFGNGFIAEGIEIQARSADSPGEVWIRGLLINGDVYILTAWKDGGGVWGKPDYVAFFNSFQPWTD